MQTLIKDLPLDKEMDSKDMTATEGGFAFPAVMNNVAPNLGFAPPPSPPYHANPVPPTGDAGGFPDGDGGGYNLNFGGDDGTGHHTD